MTDIAIVGEAWGEEEEKQRLPFVGPSGKLLTSLLQSAGIDRHECFLTNVFNLKPKPNNNISNLCGPKGAGIPGRKAISNGKYIRAEYAPELDRLARELEEVDPNIIVCLGGTSAWAILDDPRISKARGTIGVSPSGIKAIATYHPAAVLRQWELRLTTIMDLKKAKRESTTKEFQRPKREIWIEPRIEEIKLFYDLYIKDCRRLAVDIETERDQITCIGFAPTPSIALVIPIFDRRNPLNVGSFYSEADELLAWEWIEKILDHPCDKVFQNGLYDVHFLLRRYGIAVRNFEHDTMLAHHSIMPESPKGLDYLGSIFTNEASWKLMRAKSSTIKKDE